MPQTSVENKISFKPVRTRREVKDALAVSQKKVTLLLAKEDESLKQLIFVPKMQSFMGFKTFRVLYTYISI